MKRGRPDDPDQPVIATALGLSAVSLGPMAVATLALYMAPESWNESAWRILRASGAVGLGFLGAIHWGLVIAGASGARRVRVAALCWSLVPAFLGWTILVLEPAGGPTAMLLGVGFSAQFVADRRAHRAGYCPQWYLAIRSWLTAAALGCLLAALLKGGHY